MVWITTCQMKRCYELGVSDIDILSVVDQRLDTSKVPLNGLQMELCEVLICWEAVDVTHIVRHVRHGQSQSTKGRDSTL